MFTIDRSQAESLTTNINSELVYYFGHVISELKEFYSIEYEMFEMLACGQIADYLELSMSMELTKHLYDYGLIEDDDNRLPSVKLPVAATFVATELAKDEQRKALYKLVRLPDRKCWIKIRIKSIIQDMRQLEVAIAQSGKPKLFGNYSFPEADRLIEIPEVDSETTFIAFINTMNRSFVESIEYYGKEIGNKSYFWNVISIEYPVLYKALYRVKVYRHSQDHLRLTPQIEHDYHTFMLEDTDGFTNTDDKLFAIQQRLLDSLLTGIQVELNKIT